MTKHMSKRVSSGSIDKLDPVKMWRLEAGSMLAEMSEKEWTASATPPQPLSLALF